MQNSVAHLIEDAALLRLGALAPLADADRQALGVAVESKRRVAARKEVLAEGEPIRRASVLLTGWACRVRELKDGRRQILGFVLPGELIGRYQHTQPCAPNSVLALTELMLCPAPEPVPGSGLAEAYAISAALEEVALLRQVTRLGRLTALERTADLLLELHDRLALGGMANGRTFSLPVTQETLADVLGLTSVHVNRTLQVMRRDGLLTLSGGTVSLPDRARLAALVDYRPATVPMAA